MTFKVEPVAQSTLRRTSAKFPRPSNGSASNRLDSWHKVEESGSGVTYYYHSAGLPRTKNPTHPLHPVQLGPGNYSSPSRGPYYHKPSPNQSSFGGNLAENFFSLPRRKESRNQERERFSSNGQTSNGAGGLIWQAGTPTTSGNTYHTRPTVVLRKPRTRRFIRTLLCCFGAKPVDPPRSVPLDPPSTGPYSPKPSEKLLLPPVRSCDINKKCLIIDLDETLVHSSFKVYVLKRPFVDEFLQRIGDLFECILFTASLAKYADPVADLLDKWGCFRARLFREACVFHKGNYVKDLNRLGRDLKRVVIVDNSPASYAFHPDNAIPVQSWFDDMSDTELLDLVPILERLAKVDNVYNVLRNSNEPSPPPPSLEHHHHSQ